MKKEIRRTSFTVDNLPADAQFEFIVRAKNQFGLGPPSNKSRVIVTRSAGEGFVFFCFFSHFSVRFKFRASLRLFVNVWLSDFSCGFSPRICGWVLERSAVAETRFFTLLDLLFFLFFWDFEMRFSGTLQGSKNDILSRNLPTYQNFQAIRPCQATHI